MEIDWGDRFWSKVCPEPNSGCWLWTAAYHKGGYGVFQQGQGRGTIRAHQYVWLLLISDVLPEVVCHRCDTPACCNPVHLFAGTHVSNALDRDKKDRVACGEGSGAAKLTLGQVQDLLRERQRGALLKDLALQYNLSVSGAHAITKGRNWRRALEQVHRV